MTIRRILDIFGRTIDDLQLCQCVREVHGGGGALERVILHAISGGRKPPEALNKSYGNGVTLNEILDAKRDREVA